MSDFPNRLFIFPKKGVKKKDWKGRDNIIFSDLCAQTIPQNRYVAEREFININSIWHDASEEPKTGPACIVEVEIDSAEELTNCSGYVESRFDEKLGWSTDYLSVLNDAPGVTFEVKKWAYIADLLPHGDEYTKDYPKTQKI